MIKKLFIYLNISAMALLGCKDEETPPTISFDTEGVTGLFAGDDIMVMGKISAGSSDVSAFWFHRKISEAGNLDEQTGGRLELASDGSFVIPITLEKSTVGVKVIAEDAGGRTVKLFPVILGADNLLIAFDGASSIETIDAGDDMHIKGSVTSGTPITAFNYTVVKGDLKEPPVNIALTGQVASTFDLTLPARAGMTGILFTAENRGALKTEKLFEIKHVASAASVLFDSESINVKPDSTFLLTGSVISDRLITSLTYTVFRVEGADAPVTASLGSDNKFAISISAAGARITAVAVTATDDNNKSGEATIPVKVLFPERIDGNVMLHYKYLIFTDSRSFEKSYFSFDVAPYVMNKEQALANQAKIDLMYTNVFIANNNANNGAALFGANAYWASTILASAMVEGWTLSQNDTRLARLPVRTDLASVLGKSFDELDDSEETWNNFNTYANAISSSNSVLRAGTAASTVQPGTIFLIKFGGVNSTGNTGITRNAVGIVRGKGGSPSTATGQSTGAWLEIEIKVRK